MSGNPTGDSQRLAPATKAFREAARQFGDLEQPGFGVDATDEAYLGSSMLKPAKRRVDSDACFAASTSLQNILERNTVSILEATRSRVLQSGELQRTLPHLVPLAEGCSFINKLFPNEEFDFYVVCKDGSAYGIGMQSRQRYRRLTVAAERRAEVLSPREPHWAEQGAPKRRGQLVVLVHRKFAVGAGEPLARALDALETSGAAGGGGDSVGADEEVVIEAADFEGLPLAAMGDLALAADLDNEEADRAVRLFADELDSPSDDDEGGAEGSAAAAGAQPAAAFEPSAPEKQEEAAAGPERSFRIPQVQGAFTLCSNMEEVLYAILERIYSGQVKPLPRGRCPGLPEPHCLLSARQLGSALGVLRCQRMLAPALPLLGTQVIISSGEVAPWGVHLLLSEGALADVDALFKESLMEQFKRRRFCQGRGAADACALAQILEQAKAAGPGVAELAAALSGSGGAPATVRSWQLLVSRAKIELRVHGLQQARETAGGAGAGEGAGTSSAAAAAAAAGDEGATGASAGEGRATSGSEGTGSSSAAAGGAPEASGFGAKRAGSALDTPDPKRQQQDYVRWTPQMDIELLEAAGKFVNARGTTNYEEVSKVVGRTPKACAMRMGALLRGNATEAGDTDSLLQAAAGGTHYAYQHKPIPSVSDPAEGNRPTLFIRVGTVSEEGSLSLTNALAGAAYSLPIMQQLLRSQLVAATTPDGSRAFLIDMLGLHWAGLMPFKRHLQSRGTLMLPMESLLPFEVTQLLGDGEALQHYLSQLLLPHAAQLALRTLLHDLDLAVNGALAAALHEADAGPYRAGYSAGRKLGGLSGWEQEQRAVSPAAAALFDLALGGGLYQLNTLNAVYEHARRLAAAEGLDLPSAWGPQAAHSARYHGGNKDLTERLNEANELFAKKMKDAEITASWAGSRDSNWAWVGRVAAKLGDKGARFKQIVKEVQDYFGEGATAAEEQGKEGGELKSTMFWRWWANMLAEEKKKEIVAKGPVELRTGRPGR